MKNKEEEQKEMEELVTAAKEKKNIHTLKLEVPKGTSSEEAMSMIVEKLKKQFPDKEIKMPPREKAKFYQKEIEMLMDCFGIQIDFVTDLSSIDDFGLSDEDIQEVAKEVGVEINRGDKLWQIAMRMVPNN